jgi:hypothetical protein
MSSRPTLLTTAALTETAPDAPAAVAPDRANPQVRDATTPLFYMLLGFIMLSLVVGVFAQF